MRREWCRVISAVCLRKHRVGRTYATERKESDDRNRRGDSGWGGYDDGEGRTLGGARMTSSITKEAADELGLEVGKPVIVVVKASDVMLAVD